MSTFNEDLARNLQDPEFALAYGAEQKQLQIIKLLEDSVENLDTTETGYAASSANMSIRIKTINSIIALIQRQKNNCQ